MDPTQYVIFSREALEKADGLTVPLVKYDNDGERHVIGEATLHVDKQGLFADFTVDDEASLTYLKDQGIL
jgi:hypothetical protein